MKVICVAGCVCWVLAVGEVRDVLPWWEEYCFSVIVYVVPVHVRVFFGVGWCESRWLGWYRERGGKVLYYGTCVSRM